MAADIPPVLPGGTYEVTRGGTWGEEIEWVVRDVRWMLADGRVFTIDEGVWHYRLPDAPVDMGR